MEFCRIFSASCPDTGLVLLSGQTSTGSEAWLRKWPELNNHITEKTVLNSTLGLEGADLLAAHNYGLL